MALLILGRKLRYEGEIRRTRRRGTPLAFVLAAVVLFSAIGATELNAQAPNPKEYQIKAVFLFNFVQFVEWPAAAFSSADAPIRIGVLGDDPFAGALQAVVQNEKVRQRSIVVQRVQRFQDAAECQVVFACRSERTQVGTIIAALGDKPILTVGDMQDFARQGGIVNFYLEGQKVRFEINRAAAQRSGLKLSSQLLGLARLVGPQPNDGDQ